MATVQKVSKKPVHPPVADMVKTALKELKDRKGSSLAAIKKHIAANNKVNDISRLAPFIRKALKKAVEEGKIVQVKGTGASGSFKLSKEKEEKKVIKKKVAAKKSTKEISKKKAKESPKKKSLGSKKAEKATKSKSTPQKKSKTANKKVEKKPTKPKATKPKKPVAKKTSKK